MAIKYGTNNQVVNGITYNDTNNVKRLYLNNTQVWGEPLTIFFDSTNNLGEWNSNELTAYSGDILTYSSLTHRITCTAFEDESMRWENDYTLPDDTDAHAYSLAGIFIGQTELDDDWELELTSAVSFNAQVSTETLYYSVSVSAGDGVSGVYLGLSPYEMPSVPPSTDIVPGSTYSEQYAYGETVYSFAILDDYYDPVASNWILVHGQSGETGSIYRTGQVTIDSTVADAGYYNFGTQNATIETHSLTITKGTGISTIYYRITGTQSWTSSVATVVQTFNALTTVEYYATAAEHYSANADCGTASNPQTITILGENASVSVTATIDQFRITWKYITSAKVLNGNDVPTWGITTEYYNYNATVTPPVTPQDLLYDSNKRLYLVNSEQPWDDLSTVTAERTITAQYQNNNEPYYLFAISNTLLRCSSESNTGISYNRKLYAPKNNTVSVTWVADSDCAFEVTPSVIIRKTVDYSVTAPSQILSYTADYVNISWNGVYCLETTTNENNWTNYWWNATTNPKIIFRAWEGNAFDTTSVSGSVVGITEQEYSVYPGASFTPQAWYAHLTVNFIRCHLIGDDSNPTGWYDGRELSTFSFQCEGNLGSDNLHYWGFDTTKGPAPISDSLSVSTAGIPKVVNISADYFSVTWEDNEFTDIDTGASVWGNLNNTPAASATYIITNANYAYDSSGTSTHTITASEPGSYGAVPEYAKVNLSYSDCHNFQLALLNAAGNVIQSGTYTSGTTLWLPRNPSIGGYIAYSYVADTNFYLDTEQHTAYTSNALAIPYIETNIGPKYCTVTVQGVWCASVSISDGTVINATGTPPTVNNTAVRHIGDTITWNVARIFPAVPYTDALSYEEKGSYPGASPVFTTTASITGPNTYGRVPNYAYLDYTGKHCSWDLSPYKPLYQQWYQNNTLKTYDIDLTCDSGWYWSAASGTSVTVKTITTTLPAVITDDPTYVSLTVTGAHCTIYVGQTQVSSGWSGIVEVNTEVAVYADDGYCYDANGNTFTRTFTVIQPTSLGSDFCTPSYAALIVQAKNCVANARVNYNSATILNESISNNNTRTFWIPTAASGDQSTGVTVYGTSATNWYFDTNYGGTSGQQRWRCPTTAELTSSTGYLEITFPQTIIIEAPRCRIDCKIGSQISYSSIITFSDESQITHQAYDIAFLSSDGITEAQVGYNNKSPIQYGERYAVVFPTDSPKVVYGPTRYYSFTGTESVPSDANYVLQLDVSGPATFNPTPAYGWLQVNTQNCSVTANDSGWYEIGTAVRTTFSADEGWSYSSSHNPETTITTLITSTTSPDTITADQSAPNYYKLDIKGGSSYHCDAFVNNVNKNNTEDWYTGTTTITWKPHTGYSFASGAAQTNGSSSYSAYTTNVTNSPQYGLFALNLVNCHRYSGSANNNYYLITDTKTNWPSMTVRASDNFRFSYVSADQIVTAKVPYSARIEPMYGYLVNGADEYDYSIPKIDDIAVSDGYYHLSKTVTYVADDYYAFDASGTTSYSLTTWTPGDILTHPATFAKAKSIAAGSHSTVDKNADTYYAANNRTITWTAAEGYCFDQSDNDATEITATLVGGGEYAPTQTYRKKYTMTFNNPTYGYWTDDDDDIITSKTIYYGDKIVTDGDTVTCYNWSNLSAIRWEATVHKTANTAQYSYGSATPITGDTSVNKVTSNLTVSGASNSRTVNQYTVTWKYQTAYGTWTPDPGQQGAITSVYKYGDIPGTSIPVSGTTIPTPANTVNGTGTGNGYRYVLKTGDDKWDDLSEIHGHRTIYANYYHQMKVKVQGTRCSIKVDGVSKANNNESWYAVGTHTITWDADDNCRHNSDGTGNTYSKTINATGTYNNVDYYTFNYIYATIELGNNNASKTKNTGWHAYGADCTWTALPGYGYGYAGDPTYTESITEPGETYTNSPDCVEVKAACENCAFTEDSAKPGWYPLSNQNGLTFIVKATSDWRFTSESDTTTYPIRAPQAPIDLGTFSPTYFKLTINHGSNCTVDKDTGWYDTPQTITWTVTDSSKYAFDDVPSFNKQVTTAAAPGTYTETPEWGYYKLNLTHCEYNSGTAQGWYKALGQTKSTVVKASQNWRFASSGNGQDTLTISATVPGTASASPSWYYITVGNSTSNASADVSTGWKSGIVPITWTVTDNNLYAYDNSGSPSTSYNISEPGTYNESPRYGRYEIQYDISCQWNSGNTSNWYLLTANLYTVAKAKSGWSFGGSSTEDTKRIPTSGTVHPPFAYTFSASSCQITMNGTHASTAKIDNNTVTLPYTGIVAENAKLEWWSESTYAYDYSGVNYYTTNVNRGPDTYTKNVTHAKYDLVFTNCKYSDGNKAGFYSLGTAVQTTAEANTNWYFGSLALDVFDVWPEAPSNVPQSHEFSPTYIKVTVNGDHCTIRQGSTSGTVRASGWSGIVPVGTKFYWIPAQNYSYAAGTTQQNTSYTFNTPENITKTPGFGKLSSVTAVRCGCDHNTTNYYAIGETIKFTANQYCAFNSDGTQTEDTSNVVAAGGTPSATAGYINVTALNPGNNCTVKSGTTTGWQAYHNKLYWVAKTGYAFDNNNTTETYTLAEPGANGHNATYLRYYTITFSGPTYGSWGSATKTAYHFDTLSKSGTTVTCYEGSTSTARWTNTVTKATDTAQWTYSTPNIGTVPSTVTGTATISATDGHTENKYNVTFTDGSYGAWDSLTAINVPYSTQITISGNTVTVGSTSRSYIRNTNTAQYTYGNTIKVGGSTTTPQTVGTGKAVTSTDTRTTNKYAVTITKGTGISSVFLSLLAPDTSAHTPASGDASGTQYFYGVPVYAYAVLAEHYDIPANSGWTLVKGTANATGAIYHVATLDSVSGAHNFGTINAAIEKYTLTIAKGTGIATIYYKVNGASSYTSSTSNVSVSVNDQSTYYYYAVADEYHTVRDDCGTSASPKTGTVNCANVSASVNTDAKTYYLAGEWTNGTVKYYSTSAHTTQITQATYGSTVYYTLTGDQGYRNGTSGSITLNSTYFSFLSGVATHNFGAALRISAPLSQGTLPAGVASITCYRKPYDGSSYSIFTGNTIYYGDSFYWTATAATGYNNPTLTYYDASHTTTWTGSQGNGINSVAASGLSAGSRKSFTITLAKASSHNYFDWKNGSTTVTSMTAYYGDIISTSDNVVTCKKWDATSTTRWSVTATAYTNTTQYSYTTPTVTGGSISSVTAAATITGSNNRNTNTYTITWKYQTAYNTWDTSTQTVYYYGATPGTSTKVSGDNPPTPSQYVTSGNKRYEKYGWDSLATVTGNRTITMTYLDQVKVTTVSTFNCKVYINSDYQDEVTPNTWYYIENAKDTDTLENGKVYIKADPNCGLHAGQAGEPYTQWTCTMTSGGDIDEEANMVYVTSATGPHCSADITANTWTLFGNTITWTADEGWCFSQSNNQEDETTEAIPGAQTAPTTYPKRFALTISVTNGSYGTYSVSRTSSPNQGAATGVLNNNAYIYYGDVLTGTSSGNGVSYSAWDITSVTKPTATSTGDAKTGNMTVTNKDSHTATLYYNTTNATGGTSLGSTASNGTQTKTGLTFGSTYYISARVSRSRSKYTDTASNSNYTGTAKVEDAVTANFSFSRATTTDPGTIDSATEAVTLATRNSYTVTWSYLSSYPDTATTGTSTYYWGQVPGTDTPLTGSVPSPQTVTKSNNLERRVFVNWDDLSELHANRTINATYSTQYNVTGIGNTRCNAYTNTNYNVLFSTGWYNPGTKIYWKAEQYCAFAIQYSPVITTTTSTINAGGIYANEAPYVQVTQLNPTHCSTTTTVNTWLAYDDPITWTADAAYCFDYTDDNITEKTTGARPGANSCTAAYLRRYTLTVNVNNGSYGTCSITRTPTYSEAPAAETWSGLTNGTTKVIYYGDKLTTSHSQNSNGSVNWGSYGTVTTPDVTSTGDAISGNIKVTNKDSEEVTLYYNTSNSTTNGTSLGTATYNNSRTKTGLSFGTTYYCYAVKTVYRSGWHYVYGDTSTYSGTTKVTANVTANFSFTRSQDTSDSSSTTGYSAIKAHTAAARNKYTITWKYLTGYSTWTPDAGQSGAVTTQYYWGETPSRSTPSFVSSGSYGKRVNTNYTNGWDSLDPVSGNRTITCQYINQVYITFSKTRCEAYRASSYSGATYSSGWFDTSSTAFTVYWKTSDTNLAFYALSGTVRKQETESVTPNEPKIVSHSADYIYATITGDNCNISLTSGWNVYNAVCYWDADSGYAFDYSGTTRKTANITTPGGTYDHDATWVYVGVSCNNCELTSTSPKPGWYQLGASSSNINFVAKAKPGWSFVGSSAEDTQTVSVRYPQSPIPDAVDFSPSYFYLTFNGTNCHAVKNGTSTTLTSGFYSSSVVFYWQTDSDSYAFNSSGSHSTGTTTATGPATYENSSGYGKYTVSTDSNKYTTNVSTGWYAVTSSKTTTFTAKNGWSFGGSTANDSTTRSAAVPGSVSAIPAYCSITVKGDHCTITVGSNTRASGWSGIVAENTSISWQSANNYAYDDVPTRIYLDTARSPGTYEKYVSYGYLSISATNCTVTNNGAGWYAIGSVTTTFKADDGWSFGGSTNRDTTTDTHTVPATNSASPSYFYITVSATNCSASASTGWYTSSTKPSSITWTTGSTYTYYSFDAGTTQTNYTNSSISNGPAIYSASPTNYRVSSVATGTYNQSVSINNSTYYASGTRPVWTAKSNYYYGSSSSNTTSTGLAISPGASVLAPNPSYINITVSSTRCKKIVVGSTERSSGWMGIVAVGTVITYTASDGYSFAAGTSQTATSTQTVALGTLSYQGSADYMNVTIGGSNNTSISQSSGYRLIGSTITWTPSTGTNYKYSYNNTPVAGPTDAQRQTSATITVGTTTYNRSPSYTYYNVTITKNTNTASSNYSSGYILSGTTIRFTATANETNRKYSYSTSSADTHYTDYTTVSSAGQSISSPTVYIWMNCSASNPSHCSMTAGWYRVGTSITWTAESGTNYKYSFSSFPATAPSTTAISTVVNGTTSYTASADYIYYNVTVSPATNCSADYSSGYILNGTTITFTTTAATSAVRYSFSTSSSSSYTTTGSVSSAGQNIASGTVYTWYYVTVSANHGSAVTANGTGWYRSGTSNTSTWTVTDAAAYTFAASPSTTSTTTSNGSGAWNPSSGKVVSGPTVYARGYTIYFDIDHSSWGSWGNSSKVGYYNDKMAISGTTLNCYQGNTTTLRWSNTITPSSGTNDYYTYSAYIDSSTVPSFITGGTTVEAVASRSGKTYKLQGNCVTGTVTYYTNSNYTTTTSYGTYGSYVYYRVVADTAAYQSTSGSHVLNTTNYSFAGYAANSTATATFMLSKTSGTLSQGTLPTGVASITCYKKNGTSWNVYNSGTIYYGDQFYWTATAANGYYAPTVTYGSSSNPYTWMGTQWGTITSVGASGLRAGSVIPSGPTVIDTYTFYPSCLYLNYDEMYNNASYPPYGWDWMNFNGYGQITLFTCQSGNFVNIFPSNQQLQQTNLPILAISYDNGGTPYYYTSTGNGYPGFRGNVYLESTTTTGGSGPMIIAGTYSDADAYDAMIYIMSSGMSFDSTLETMYNDSSIVFLAVLYINDITGGKEYMYDLYKTIGS